MKNIKYLFLSLILTASFTSCLVEDNDLSALNDDGPSVAGFIDSKKGLNATADGQEYEFMLGTEVKGPNFRDLSGDVDITISVDPASTAIEGTHYRLSSATSNISEANNYLGEYSVTVLTNGIQAPLDEAPVLILNVASSTGGTNVVNSGKQVVLTLNYLCFSDLAGNYAWGTYQPLLALTQVSPGTYRMPYLGRFSSIYWLEFSDVCGVLTVTDWQFQGSNPITQNAPGFVDTNGDLVFPSLDVAGVSWYVGLEVRYTKL